MSCATDSIAHQVRSRFASKNDVDDDILAYVISCLEDETFEFGGDGEEIYETVGMMLVRFPPPYVLTVYAEVSRAPTPLVVALVVLSQLSGRPGCCCCCWGDLVPHDSALRGCILHNVVCEKHVGRQFAQHAHRHTNAQVSGGCCDDDDEAKSVCKDIAGALKGAHGLELLIKRAQCWRGLSTVSVCLRLSVRVSHQCTIVSMRICECRAVRSGMSTPRSRLQPAEEAPAAL